MPKRTDIQSILVIGAGPIIIGQACEFDYSGVQAIKALKGEGYRVILVNSNPATIMTDPGLADATYIEPITPDFVEKIIEIEKPDALLPTMGGQTALNCALALEQAGVLSKHGVELIGARADAIEMANNAYLRDGGLSGISTGLKDLDNKMGGLQRSDLIVLAGRPSMGKTALATNIAFQIANAHKAEQQPDGTIKDIEGAVVAFFSLEMSAEQLATRIISEQAEIPSEKIRRGMIDETDFRKLVEKSQQLNEVPLYIDQTGGISIAQLCARARKLKRQKNLGVIIIDYLQLLSGSKKTGEGRVNEVTEITTGLKALAKELEVPVIALSQLSRQVENRDDKRPQLSDLRESGSIEQDADVVMFVYREEYYVSRAQPSETDVEATVKWQDEMAQVEGKAEVIIGKQRHGPTGSVQLAFNGNFTRFSDLAEDDHMPYRTD